MRQPQSSVLLAAGALDRVSAENRIGSGMTHPKTIFVSDDARLRDGKLDPVDEEIMRQAGGGGKVFHMTSEEALAFAGAEDLASAAGQTSQKGQAGTGGQTGRKGRTGRTKRSAGTSSGSSSR